MDFAGWLHKTGHTGDLWPPDRNASCWCGSGGKYKNVVAMLPHMYAFETGTHTFIDPRSGSGEATADGERLVSIATQAGATFTYVYDFGDQWTHTVTVEEIRPGGVDNTFIVHGGEGACPPEDTGGVARYQYLLDALADPSSPDHDEAVDWLGADFQPARVR